MKSELTKKQAASVKTTTMTQEELEHWKDIAKAVFAAENAVIDQWQPKLKAAKKMTDEEQIKVIDEYLTAVATEIVSKTSDEQLSDYYGDY